MKGGFNIDMSNDYHRIKLASLVLLFGVLLIFMIPLSGASLAAVGASEDDPAEGDAHLTINTVDLAGMPFTGGIWTTIRSSDDNNTILKTGFTPLEFEGTVGTAYKVTVSNFDGKTFHHWQDNNSTEPTRTVTLAAKNTTTLTAVYDLGEALRGFTPLTYNGTDDQLPSLTVNATTLDGKSLSMWTIIDPQNVTNEDDGGDGEKTATYRVYAGDYDDIVFDHWEDDGSTDMVRTITIAEPTTITALYNITMVPMPEETPKKTDFNGDGYSDLAVGVPGEEVNGESDAGLVNVIYGSDSGLSPSASIPDQVFHQGMAGDVEGTAKADDRFGTDVAASDFNGDGYSDLAVGAPGDDYAASTNNTGSVNVIYGSSSGLSATADQIFTGGSAGLEDTISLPDCTSPAVPDLPIQGFGSVLVAGDFNGDGYEDLAVIAEDDVCLRGQGSVGEFWLNGSLHIIYGSSSGLSTSATLDNQYTVAHQITFYSTLEAGDFNNDGIDDLAAGDPSDFCCSGAAGPGPGYVDIFYGQTGGFAEDVETVRIVPDQHWTQGSLDIEGEGNGGESFGSALISGDFNDDSYGDLAIGVEDEIQGGAVNVIYGSPSGLSATFVQDQLFTEDSPDVDGSSEEDDRFGSALAAGDFNGDGIDDIAIGVPGEDVDAVVDAGSSNIIYGSTLSGLSPTAVLPDMVLNQNSAGIEGTSEASDSYSPPSFRLGGFGASIASGDFDNDGYGDLAIGVPGEDVDTMVDAGSSNIVYGSSSGISPTANMVLDQNSPDVEDESEEGDQFGYSTD